MNDKLTDEDQMPFGKFGPKNGDPRKMKDVPASYLLWLRDEGCSHQGVKNYIETNLVSLMDEEPDWIHPDDR